MVSCVRAQSQVCMSIYTRRVWEKGGFVWEAQSHTGLGAAGGAAPGSTNPSRIHGGKKIPPLSCSRLTVWKGIASQCFSLFLASYSLKNSNFYFFSLKENYAQFNQKQSPLQLFIQSIYLIILYIFPPQTFCFNWIHIMQ